jgi:hypothetical protein
LVNPVFKRATLLALSALAGFGPANVRAAVPDWLRQLDSVAVPDHDEEVDAVILLDETEMTVLPDGKVRSLERRAYRILRPGSQGRGLAMAFVGKDDKLISIRGWSIPKTGKPFESDPKGVVESALVPGAEAALVTDRRMKLLTIPAVNPGNLVGYEIEQLNSPAMIGDRWMPRDSIPVVRARFRLRLPPGWTYTANWTNGGAVKPVLQADGAWQWELLNIEPIRSEAMAPPLPVLAETLQIAVHGPAGKPSSFVDWNDMGRWFNTLVDERSGVNAALESQARERSAGKAAIFDKVKALSESAQKDIRYVHIALDAAGYQPRPPVEVLSTGYGDCKDKANYLRVMLRQIGVESHLVLVNTQRGVVQASTAPGPVFDHAVLAIRLPADAPAAAQEDMAMISDGKGGALLLFDPTDTLTPFGRIGEHLRANSLLLVLEDSARIIAAPAGAPSDSGVNRVVTMKLGEDGTLSGSVREEWRGVWARVERERMAGADQMTDVARPLQARLADSISSYQIDSAAISARLAIDKPLEWRYSLSARGYSRKAGDLLMVRPRVVGSKAESFLDDGEQRRNPVAYDSTHRDVDTMRIELPPGYKVESLPEPMNLATPFATYRRSTRIEAGALVYERVLELNALDIPLSQVEALREFQREIRRDERAMAVLKKASPP